MKTSGGLQRSAMTDESTDRSWTKDLTPKFGKHGNTTGHDYFRCTSCGVEVMRRLGPCDNGCNCGEAPQ